MEKWYAYNINEKHCKMHLMCTLFKKEMFMKKLIMLFIATVVCLVFAQPGPFMHHRPMPPPPMHRHHHHHSSAPFWTGVGIGVAGSLFLPPSPPPVSIVPPSPIIVPYHPRVWVPPVYGERPIYRAGIYVGTERYIIAPGHWR